MRIWFREKMTEDYPNIDAVLSWLLILFWRVSCTKDSCIRLS